MDFSSLVKAVQDFWDFVWPPVVCLILLWAVTAFVAPALKSAVIARVFAMRPTSEAQVALFKTLKRFSLDKLVPVIVAFVLLFALNVTHVAILLVAQLLPPSVSYNPDELLMAHSSSVEVRGLWYKLGQPGTVGEFRREIERSVSEAKEAHKDSPLITRAGFWESKQSSEYVAFSSCKFFILWAAFVALVEARRTKYFTRPVLRFILITACACIVAVVFAVRFVYAVEQSEYALINAADAFAPQTSLVCEPSEGDPCSEYQNFVEAESRHSKPHWWFITRSDAGYWHWLGEQFREPSLYR